MCFKNTLDVCVAFCSFLSKVKVGSCITRLTAAEDSAREQGHASPRSSFSLSLRRFIALLISRQAYYSTRCLPPCSVCGHLVLEVAYRSRLTSELKVRSFSLQHKS